MRIRYACNMLVVYPKYIFETPKRFVESGLKVHVSQT
jgi:hypothetical protein